MNKFYLKLAVAFCAITCYGNAQNVTIPDPNFKNYLIANTAINLNGDSEIQVSEAVAFDDTIACFGMSITDMQGIEAFVNLKGLACVANQISYLDISQNTSLEFLICSVNQLTSLDVSANVMLKNLRCAMNEITTLNVSQNPDLEYLYCGSNLLSALDVSQNTQLRELDCEANNIALLNTSGMTMLQKLNCSSNMIASLDLTDSPLLTELRFPGNSIQSLDVSQNVALQYIQCASNELAELDLTNNAAMKILDCPFNQLTNLDLSQCPELMKVWVFSNALNTLNVANGNNAGLQILWTSGNPNLTCIKVDDVNYSTTNWRGNNFQFDAQTEFNLDCVNDLQENGLAAITLYPNPFNDVILLSSAEKGVLTVHSATGQLLYSFAIHSGENTLDLAECAEGTYWVRAETTSGKHFSTLITK
jgi:hypothetical protein